MTDALVTQLDQLEAAGTDYLPAFLTLKRADPAAANRWWNEPKRKARRRQHRQQSGALAAVALVLLAVPSPC